MSVFAMVSTRMFTKTAILQFTCSVMLHNLFPPKWLRMTWNSQFCPIHNLFNLFPLKWLRMTQNSQFRLICNFSNLFPPKWLRMTQNSHTKVDQNAKKAHKSSKNEILVFRLYSTFDYQLNNLSKKI